MKRKDKGFWVVYDGQGRLSAITSTDEYWREHYANWFRVVKVNRPLTIERRNQAYIWAVRRYRL